MKLSMHEGDGLYLSGTAAFALILLFPFPPGFRGPVLFHFWSVSGPPGCRAAGRGSVFFSAARPCAFT